MKNIPNFITSWRLFSALAIVGLAVASADHGILAFPALFIIAGISDMLDGIIARRFNLCTTFGAKLDSISDLALVNLLSLEQLEATILRAQTWLADAVITNLKVSAGARYYARLGTEKSDELVSHLANQLRLDQKITAQWQKNREGEEAKQAEKLVQTAVNIAQGK